MAHCVELCKAMGIGSTLYLSTVITRQEQGHMMSMDVLVRLSSIILFSQQVLLDGNPVEAAKRKYEEVVKTVGELLVSGSEVSLGKLQSDS